MRRLASGRILLALLVLTATSTAVADAPVATQSLEDEELAVVAAAIHEVHGEGAVRWVMVADQTTSFACESAAATGFSVGDCGGMRSRDQSPADVLAWVRQEIPAVTKDLTDSLATRADGSVTIDRPFPVKMRQVIRGPTSSASTPEGLGSPDLALYVSRVGFNGSRSAALLYLGIVSWADASKSAGEYLYLTKGKDGWTVQGRARFWQLAP